MPKAFQFASLLTLTAIFVFTIGLVPWNQSETRADNVESVETFLARKANWSKLRGAVLAVEGRVNIITPDEVRFQKCDAIKFYPEGFKAEVRGDVKVIAVTGRIDLNDENKLVFKIIKIEPRPSDEESLGRRRGAIDTSKPAQWYDVAEWASTRGTFYNDKKMLEVVDKLREEGIRTEVRQTPSTDAAAMRNLVTKAKNFSLPVRFSAELAQEAYRREYERLWDDQRFRKKKPDYSILINDIQRDLPGTNLKLAEDDLELRHQYEARPTETYLKADDDTRRKLHRDLYSRVLIASILSDEDPDGRNGYVLAERIDQQLPEYHAQAEELREKELAFQFSKLGTATKTDLTALTTRYLDRQQVPKVNLAKQKWLELRETRLRKDDGARGLVEVGDDYREMMKDTETAVRLYVEANRMNPNLAEPLKRLEELGYVREGGRWMTKESHQAVVETPRPRAVEEGVVRTGMTAKEVRAALGGPPASTARFATFGKVHEIWFYDGAQLSIHFTRSVPNGDLRVVNRNSVTK